MNNTDNTLRVETVIKDLDPVSFANLVHLAGKHSTEDEYAYVSPDDFDSLLDELVALRQFNDPIALRTQFDIDTGVITYRRPCSRLLIKALTGLPLRKATFVPVL